MPASPMRHSPHRSQPTPMQGPAGAAWGNTNRPSSARSLGAGDFSDRISQGSSASVSGQGHAGLPHGLLQPGMNSVQPSAWVGGAFAPHSTDPQLGLALPDQLVPQRDPVVSPGYMHRSAPARPFQPGPGFNPAAPLLSYVQQETRDHAPRPQVLIPAAGLGPAAASANMPSADDIFLNDILAGQEEDNKPVGIYAAPAAAAPAAAALWPALDAVPLPGGPPHLASVHPLGVSFLSTPPCPHVVPVCCDSEVLNQFCCHNNGRCVGHLKKVVLLEIWVVQKLFCTNNCLAARAQGITILLVMGASLEPHAV